MKNDQENELIGIYRGLLPENREIFLQNARVMRVTEQAVKRQYGLDQEQPAQRQREPAAHVGMSA